MYGMASNAISATRYSCAPKWSPCRLSSQDFEAIFGDADAESAELISAMPTKSTPTAMRHGQIGATQPD